jgi:hypothetical protein
MTNTNYPSATSQTNSNPSPKNEGGSKNILIGVLALALLGTLGYILWNNNAGSITGNTAKNKELTTVMSESDSLRQMFILAETRLDSITGANSNLHGEKTALQKEIDTKKNEISKILSAKNSTQADLKRAQQLIAVLNGQIGKLEIQIAQLRGDNQQLTTQNVHLVSEKKVMNQNLQTRTTENDELASTVDVGSTLSASNMTITPFKEKRNGKEKETSIAKRVDKMNVAFNVENRITTSGPADLYVIVTDPKGSIIQANDLGSGAMTTRQDGDRNFTTKVPIEYEQGTRKGVSFSIHNPNGFLPGDYRIEVYHNGFKIGEGIKSLKKNIFG